MGKKNEDPAGKSAEADGKAALAQQPKETQAGTEMEREFVIFAPTPVNQVIGTVAFTKGVGRTRDAWLASWFARKGYRVKEGL